MSDLVEWSLFCDARTLEGKRCAYPAVRARGHSDYATRAIVRATARSQGWQCDENGDRCPDHVVGFRRTP